MLKRDGSADNRLAVCGQRLNRATKTFCQAVVGRDVMRTVVGDREAWNFMFVYEAT